MGFFDMLFGKTAPPKPKFPRRVDGGPDIESLEITGIEGTTVNLSMQFNKKNLKAQPAPNTDIVFVIDASGSMHELYKSKQLEQAVWNILEYVLEYDDDGIDFFLHSASSGDSAQMQRLIPRLQSGQATIAEVKEVLAVKELGQIADRKQLARALDLQDSEFGMGTMCAPAIRAALEKRKPGGNLFIELVTDGTFMDNDDVIQQIVAMAKEAHAAKNPNMFRIHILGIGAQVDEAFLNTLDEGLSNLAPLDIVAFDLAKNIGDSPGLIFKELEKGFMTVGNNGTVEVKGAKITKITNAYNGVSDPELLVLERMPQTLELEIAFGSLPTTFDLEISFSDTENDDFQIKCTIPV